VADPQVLTLLGATGSIGKSTLDVVARHPDLYSIYALSAHSRVDELFEQCQTFKPQVAVVVSEEGAEKLSRKCRDAGLSTQVESGVEALNKIASAQQVDSVVAAIVGSAGLLSTLAAAKAGKRLLLANKESLVMSGQILMDAAAASGSLIMPLDSEHNAIFQSLPATSTGVNTEGMEKILLTASVKHPNWSMGPKISIDSATLMNKGLEVIEACHLFAIPTDAIEVVVHPESIIHSMVRYRDGSVIAQMGRPDMRIPIAHCLAWPSRIDSGVEPLSFFELAGLHFEKPDTTRFPLLRLAFEAQSVGGTAPTILNAANEIAVDAFLSGNVAFLQLFEIVENTLSLSKISPAGDLTTIIDADINARETALELVASCSA